MEMVLSMEAAKSRSDTVARLIVTKSLLIDDVELDKLLGYKNHIGILESTTRFYS